MLEQKQVNTAFKLGMELQAMVQSEVKSFSPLTDPSTDLKETAGSILLVYYR